MHLSPLGVLAAMCAIYLALGAVFDSLAMLLLTVPIFFRTGTSPGLDPIWFGIVVIIFIARLGKALRRFCPVDAIIRAADVDPGAP